MKHLKLTLQTAFLALTLLLPGVALGQAAAPGNFQVFSGPSQSFLQWNPSVGAAKYSVQRSYTNGGPYTLLATTTSTTYTDSAVTNGAEYYYVVAAVSNDVAGANSSEAAAIPLAANGFYAFINNSTGMALTDSNGVAIEENYAGTGQLWKLVSIGGANFAILDQGTAGLTLTAPAASAQLTVGSFTGASSQEWALQVVNGSSYLITDIGESQVLDLQGSITSGSAIGIADYDGSPNQNWIVTVPAPPLMQAATAANDDQQPQIYASATVSPNGFPTTVIFQYGTNTDYGLAVTNTLAWNGGYQGLTNTLFYTQNVGVPMHVLITATSGAGSVSSGDLTCGPLLFEEKYGPNFGSDFRWLDPLTGSAAWADLDNDGWLDLVIEGQTQYLITAGAFYYNPGTNQTAWTRVEATASGNLAAIGVGDFDNDNRPDLFLACGPQIFDDMYTPTATGFWLGSCVIQYGVDGKYNNSTNLAPLLSSAVIPNLSLQGASVAVGDFDHTGREEALVSGNLSFTNRAALEYGTRISMLYRNNNFSERSTTNSGVNPVIGDFSSTLEPIVTSLPYVGDAGEPNEGQSVLVAGDFDNDGFADLFALNFQIDSTGENYAGFFHGDGNNNFTPTTNTFRLYPNWPNEDDGSLLESASCVLADMNGDGNLDMVLSYCAQPEIYAGYVGGSTVSVWLNDGHGNLTNSNIVLPQLGLPNIAVGDIFNHGRNDILMVGYANQDYWNYGAGTQPPIETVVLRNDGNGVFTPIVLGYFGCLGETGHGLQLADYDNDGRLDFVMTGDTAPVEGSGGWKAPFLAATLIFRNEMNIPSNAPPAAPPNLSTTVGNGTVTFHWNTATDDITPANLLTYNLRVGTNSLGTQTVSPVANVITGWRKMVGPGNCGHTTNTLYHFPPGTYYWSVQAVDGGFKGGAWAPEQTFTITNPETPVLTLGTPASLPSYVSVIKPPTTKAEQDAINLLALTLLEASTNEMNIAGNTLNLSWPIRYQGWTVEQTTNLVNPVWTTNTTSIGTLNGEWSVLLTNTNTMFYRLVQ